MFKNIKFFQKSKYPIFKISFWIFVVATFLIFAKIIFLNPYIFSSQPFGYSLKPISMNMVLKKPLKEMMFICFNDYCKAPTNNQMMQVGDDLSNIYSVQYNIEDKEFLKSKVKNIYLAYPKNNQKSENVINNIDEIHLYIGSDEYYYNNDEVKKLKSKTTKIQLENQDKPADYQILVIENANNYKGIFNHVINIFLSLFHNWKYFIIPYCWLIFICLLYVFKKDEIGLKINLNKKFYYCAIGSIFAIGALIRLNELNTFSLWFDEIYTKTIATKTFLSTFHDAGNPSAFYIIEYLISKISNSDLMLKMPSFIFGIALIPMIYLLFKDINKKLGIFASFMCAINSIFIYYSAEVRSYSMCAFVGVLCVYCLFKYLKNPTIKNLIYYTLISIFAINTHYMMLFFIGANIIWGLFDFIEKKNYKELIKYLSASIVSVLTFVPYWIINSKEALSLQFNSWISSLNMTSFLKIVYQYFGDIKIFYALLALAFVMYAIILLPKEIKNRLNLDNKKEYYFNYFAFTISFVLLVCGVISYYIKPILYPRALGSVYFLLFAFEIIIISTIFDFDKIKNKFLISTKVLYSFVLMFLFFNVAFVQNMREEYVLDNFINFIKRDSVKYSKDYKIYGVMIDRKEYLDNFPQIKDLDIQWEFVNVNSAMRQSRIRKKDYVKGKQKAVIYFSSLTTDFFSVNIANPKMKTYITNTLNNGKIVFE